MTLKEAKERWPGLEINTVKYRIIRKTSPYNKNIKWFTETYREDGSLISSTGHRTEREARDSIREPFEPFWIGNEPSWTIYEEALCSEYL